MKEIERKDTGRVGGGSDPLLDPVTGLPRPEPIVLPPPGTDQPYPPVIGPLTQEV